MEKNYFITNDDEQNKRMAEQTAQLYGQGVVLSVKNDAVLGLGLEIPVVKVDSLIGYENQTYSDSGIENDLLNTGAICFLNYLPDFTYAFSALSSTYNEKDYMSDLKTLQKQGHYVKMILSEYSDVDNFWNV